MEKAKKKEKLKRQQYVNKPIPSVGTYSPEVTSTIYYNVFSKLNPYRNTVAPKESPGPADYEVLPAFKALNKEKRKYNIFGQNNQRESIVKNEDIPGPGLYNLDSRDFWNIKSYNALFINK